MVRIGTPNTPSETRLLLLGSGELGKEVAIEAQRLGLTVIAVDRYRNAPAMQVAHRAHVIAMTDGDALRRVIVEERPHFVVPELEAIATDTLLELEAEGFTVIPTARAARLTMDREGIRRLAAEPLGLTTSPYAFAEDAASYWQAIEKIGFPCVVKPIMSSSGKGQMVATDRESAERAYAYANEHGRNRSSKVIARASSTSTTSHLADGAAVGGQSSVRPSATGGAGDYRRAAAAPMRRARSPKPRREAQVTEALADALFGVEFFVKGIRLVFSESRRARHDRNGPLIPRPVRFALHVRAILGLPIGPIRQLGASASWVVLGEGESASLSYELDPAALAEPDTSLRLFGKPELHGERRLGVALARAADVAEARQKAERVAKSVKVVL